MRTARQYVIQRYHGCIVMNTFGFVLFLSSFLAFFCCSIVTLFFFFNRGNNYTEILCIDIVRIYFPRVIPHTEFHETFCSVIQ